MLALEFEDSNVANNLIYIFHNDQEKLLPLHKLGDYHAKRKIALEFLDRCVPRLSLFVHKLYARDL